MKTSLPSSRWLLAAGASALVIVLLTFALVENSLRDRRSAAIADLREMGNVSLQADIKRMLTMYRSPLASPPEPSWFEQARDRAGRVWEGLQRDRVHGISLTGAVSNEAIDLTRTFPETLRLTLRDSDITDDQLGMLTSLRQLESLHLNDTPITDAGVAHLVNFKKLKWLELNNTGITDAATVHLAQLPNLEVLRLRGTLVSDQGVMRLTALKNLREVMLYPPPGHSNLISCQMRDDFEKALPDCRVNGTCTGPSPPRPYDPTDATVDVFVEEPTDDPSLEPANQ